MSTNADFFRCLLCDSKQIDRFDKMLVCQKCGYIYRIEQGIPILVRDWQQHEAEIEQAKTVKPTWYVDEQPSEMISPWRHHLVKRRRYIEDTLGRYLQSREQSIASTLLDLGCGDGNHLGYLQKFTEVLFGSDYNLIRLARAKARYVNVTLFLADILDYPALDDFFDILFFSHVIEHIPDDEAALETAYRILKPGGLLILGAPNEGAWWWQMAYRFQPQVLASTDHVHFYTASSLCEKMLSQGFQIIEVKHMGWGLPHWSLDGRIRRYKVIDDLFDVIGHTLLPRQASSLFVLATK